MAKHSHLLTNRAKIIGKITLSPDQHQSLINLGVMDIAQDNPKSRTDTKEIIKRIGNAEAIIINISTHISKEVIKKCKQLRFIQTWSTGMDNIDLNAAGESGIIVKNVPDFSVEAVAEKTMATMIFIASKTREAHQDALTGNWNYTAFQGYELKNKTLGMIGKGRIGSRVAELAHAFGMKIIFANSNASKNEIKNICASADFLTLHCPLTEKTYHLIDRDEFNAMKKGIYFINYSRGGIVNEMELLRALDNGTVAYASLDVLEQEPPAANYSLIHHPRVFLTPHTAWHTAESVQRLSAHCIENLKNYLLNEESAIISAQA